LATDRILFKRSAYHFSVQRAINMSMLPTVLIVDDDDIYLNVAQSMVRMMGFPVLTARNGKQAIAVFEEQSAAIGCILLDIQMPELNGIEVLRYLRSNFDDVNVLIISGYIDQIKQAQLQTLAPQGYLNKPVSYDVLREKLEACTHTDE